MPEIRLELLEYEVGEIVRGQLLFVDADPRLAKCQQVTVECRARLHGAGTTEYVKAGDPLVRTGSITPPLRLPFQFVLPRDAPPSWEGRYVKVTWEVFLTLDIPWAIDPKFTQVFRVHPRGGLAQRRGAAAAAAR